MFDDEPACHRLTPGEVQPVVFITPTAGKMKIAKDGERKGYEVRKIDAADALNKKGTVVEVVCLLIGEGENETTEQEEEDDSLMAGNQEA